MGQFIGVVITLMLVYKFWWKKRGRTKILSEKQMKQKEEEFATKAYERSPTFADRVKSIEEVFEARTMTLTSVVFIDMTAAKTKHDPKPAPRYAFFNVSRNLANMDTRELTYLRIVEVLDSFLSGREHWCRVWRAALLWGDGKGVLGAGQWQGFENNREAVDAAVARQNMSVGQTIGAVQQLVTQWLGTQIDPALRAQLEVLAAKTAPSGTASFLKAGQVDGSPFAHRSDYPLHIGSFPDGSPLRYSGDGSIATIAPPGSGKTQCNVFPNLLTWKGPAVVLDVSGDIYEHSAAWRAANVGPVYKFSPLEPEDSHRYNPLTFVRSHPDYIWEDSRLLAEMMIVPSLSSDPFWENEARTVLTAAIAHVCYANPPDKRPMHAVLDVLFGGKPWDDMIFGLSMAVDVRVMTQHATSLGATNEKTLSSVLQTARSSLGAWSGERIARATVTADWSPLDLRSGTNPTIYIYIRPNEVEAYLSLLRVFIGQHIRMLTGGPVPPPGSPPILFMLDELPRLRNMPPVDEALNIGRKYGLRLWMFAQSVGQLQAAYENADGMLGSCAVRIFMNPTGADGLAEKLSEELGYVDSLNDGSRKRLVEAAELAGPDYRDRQIVMANGAKPVIVTKDFAYRSPELTERMNARQPG